MWLFDFLFPPRVDERLVRDVSRDAFCTLLYPCAVQKTDPETTALLPFKDERVRATIHEAKYHGNEKAFALLSAILVEYLREADEMLRDPALVPVPLGHLRLRERGYNQAEEVARIVAHELSLPIQTDSLVRTRDTVSQVSLSREERVRNMEGAFRAVRPVDPARTYILVDDVTTTGATLQAAIAALRAAGAAHIVPIALAH